MTAKSKKSKKRLERLVCSGLRQTENLNEYVSELRRIAESLVAPNVLRRESRLVKAIANETRLKMLRLLSKGEMCVCELTIALDLTQPTTSHHLTILENVGLVEAKKEGKWVFYRIAEPKVVENLLEFLKIASQQSSEI